MRIVGVVGSVHGTGWGRNAASRPGPPGGEPRAGEVGAEAHADGVEVHGPPPGVFLRDRGILEVTVERTEGRHAQEAPPWIDAHGDRLPALACVVLCHAELSLDKRARILGEVPPISDGEDRG